MDEQAESTERTESERSNEIRNAGGGDGDVIVVGAVASVGQRVSMDEDIYASLPASEASEEMHDAESIPDNVAEPLVASNGETEQATTSVGTNLVQAHIENLAHHSNVGTTSESEALSENSSATVQRSDERDQDSMRHNASPPQNLAEHIEDLLRSIPEQSDSPDNAIREESEEMHDAELLLDVELANEEVMEAQAQDAENAYDSPSEDRQFDVIDSMLSIDMDSDSSDIVFDEEPPVRNGHWNIPARRVYAAITELLIEGRRGEGEGVGSNQIGNLLNPGTHMQYMRRLLYRGTNSDSRRRGNGEREEEELEEEAEEEEEPENPIRFDTNLAAEHSYFGANMSRVSGVDYLEEGQQYNLMLFMHQHVLFPGELLPFMISDALIESDIDAQNGLLFGVCFPFMNDQNNDANNLYGVTCQIYEKGTDERGNTLIKSRALQRFVIKKTALTCPAPFITVEPLAKCYGLVKILPEIYLPDPLQCVNMGSMYRFRDNASMSQQYKRFQAASTPWPAHIYDNYKTTRIIDMARIQLAQHKIDTMPTDPVHLSFWLVRNLHLSENMTRTIFTTDSVNLRMKLIANTFKEDAIFTCRFCGNRIAMCNELFPMSKHGVQTQYCNSAGYIHEINTVYHVLRTAIRHSGRASTEFSWFPGYQWHIILCKICSRHIGWEFKSLEPNLVPKKFYGISRSTVRISSSQITDAQDVVYRNFMQLARQDMQ